MKVQCDVCKREEAAVFCCADEAALCGACDARVHRANKLAGKHRRFSLLHPSYAEQFPLCDICQEKRAFLFCKEDRAILCKDCDGPIHSASDLTRQHSRFLLTGIKLSPSAVPATSPAAATSDCSGSVGVSSTTSDDGEEPLVEIGNVNRRSVPKVDGDRRKRKKPTAREAKDETNPAAATSSAGFGGGKVTGECKGIGAGASNAVCAGGSSISEYLMKELPGWHVEDLLLDCTPALHPAATFAFSKMAGEDLMPFVEADLDAAAAGGLFQADGVADLSAWWVPQVPRVTPALPPLPRAHDYGHHRPHTPGMGGDLAKLAARQLQQQCQHDSHPYQQQQQHHRWTSDDCFTVPEISTVQPRPQDDAPPHKRPMAAFWCISP